MSTRSKTMGAGFASSTSSKVNVNQVTFGSRKQGLAPRGAKDHWANRATQILSDGSVKGRNTVFSMNQLGGVGAGKSQFMVASTYARPDASRMRKPYQYVSMYK